MLCLYFRENAEKCLKRILIPWSYFLDQGYCTQYSDRVTDWTAEELWFNSWQVQEIFLLSRMSCPAVGPEESPVLWVLGAKQPGHESDPFHLVLMWRIDGTLPVLPCYRGVDRDNSVLTDLPHISHCLFSVCWVFCFKTSHVKLEVM